MNQTQKAQFRLYQRVKKQSQRLKETGSAPAETTSDPVLISPSEVNILLNIPLHTTEPLVTKVGYS